MVLPEAQKVLLAAAMLGIGGRRLRSLASGDDTALREWLASESAWRLAQTRRQVGTAIAQIESAEARVVTLADDTYPLGLRDLRDPPAFLIVRGTMPLSERGGLGTAVVGTRNASEAAVHFAFTYAQRCDPPVVSGLARGVDAGAHDGALEAGRPQVAYVGHGLGMTFPPEHRALEEEVLAAGGAVASERLPGEPATRWSLVRRDRLQAAHARTIVLVQSEARGGAMHTLTFAIQLGRELAVLSPRSDGDYSGNAIAIANGARALSWEVT